MAIQSARNSLTGEPIKNRRRAATASSRLYVRRTRELTDLVGLSPRPASTHVRSAQDSLDQSDPENIGRAITSDILMQHRRSRSLSQLRTVAGNSTQRNRKDEIRYWRESYDPGFQSPTASSAAVENDDDDTGHVTLDMPELPRDDQPKTPPQPFNFGPLAGMKITHVASLDERVASLETRNEKLEKLVAQLFEMVPGVNIYRHGLQPPQQGGLSTTYTSSVGAPAMYQTTPNREHTPPRDTSSQYSTDSFGDGITCIGSIPPVPASLLKRPTSTATVRGAASLPTLAREALSDDRYSTLLSLLEAERAARQYLEAQVTRLNQKFNQMPRTAPKLDILSDPARMTVSIFEHDDDDDQNADRGSRDDVSESEAFETPKEEHPKYGFGAFGEELTDEEADGSRKRAARTLSLSQLTIKKTERTATTTESGVEL